MTKNDGFSLKNVVFILFLTIFNWFFEILKWRNLIDFIKNISLIEAAKQCLASHTASLFTPNRIGDYAAKIVYFTKSLRNRVLLLNLLSNITQMSTTLVFGIIGFTIFINKYSIDISYYRVARLLTLVVIIGVIFIFGLRQYKYKIKGVSISRIKEFVKSIPANIHIKNVIYSVIRYLIFSFQFYFLLQIFGVEILYLNAMIVITSIYLLSSIIPTIFVFDVIVKGSVALYLFSIVGVDELTILSVTTLMWLLNFVLPGVFGGYYVLNFDYYKTVRTTANTI